MCDLVYYSVRTLRVGCLTGQPYLQVKRRTARIALYSRRSVRGCLTPLLQAARVHPFETTAALARCEERLVLLRGGAATNSALVFFNGLCLGLRLRHLVYEVAYWLTAHARSSLPEGYVPREPQVDQAVCVILTCFLLFCFLIAKQLSPYWSGNNPHPCGLLHKYRVSEHIHYFTNTLEVLQQCNIFKFMA